MANSSGTGLFKCKSCGNVMSVDADDLDMQETYEEERQMGPEIFHYGQFEIDCPRCGSGIEIVYEGGEYPMGGPIDWETRAQGAEVVRAFGLAVTNFDNTLYELAEERLIELPEERRIITELNVGVVELLNRVNADSSILFSIDPREFEELIAHIFKTRGFSVELTKRSHDGGRDVIAIRSDLGIRTKFLIECKRYAPSRPVGVDLVRALYGVQQQEGANKSVLATTSRFTREALTFAKAIHTTEWLMDLKDIDDIKAWVKQSTDKR